MKLSMYAEITDLLFHVQLDPKVPDWRRWSESFSLDCEHKRHPHKRRHTYSINSAFFRAVKTNRFKNSFICYSLNSLQCEWCFYYLSVQSILRAGIQQWIDWLWLCQWAFLSATGRSPCSVKKRRGVARGGGGGCGPQRAALARGGKRAKIVFKNSRENSYCNLMCVCVQYKHSITAAARTYHQYPEL